MKYESLTETSEWIFYLPDNAWREVKRGFAKGTVQIQEYEENGTPVLHVKVVPLRLLLAQALG